MFQSRRIVLSPRCETCRDLPPREAAKKTQFGNSAKAAVKYAQSVERPIESEKIKFRGSGALRLSQNHSPPSAAALLCPASASIFDQNLTHRARYDAEKMGLVGIL